MAESSRRELFRKKSLERLSSPERLDQLLQVTGPRSWIPLWTAAALVGGLLLWSVVGEIPINVEGRGILVRPRKVVEFQSPGSGLLLELNVEVAQEVEKGDLLGTIDRPDLRERLRLEREKLGELTAQSEASRSLRSERTQISEASSRRQAESLAEHIRVSEELSQRVYDQRLQSLDEQEALLQEQEVVAKSLAASLEERWKGLKALQDQKIVAEDALDEAEEDFVDSQARLLDIQTKLSDLKTERLRANEAFIDRRQEIANNRFELNGLEIRQNELAQENLDSAAAFDLQIAEVRREIARLEAQLAQESRIVSDYAGRILEFNAVPGAFLAPGQGVGSMQVIDPDEPLISVTFFSLRDGKRLDTGKRIRVTPDTVERERYGSIKGTVTDVTPYPISLEQAESIVGNPTLAESLVSGGYLIKVDAKLHTSPDDPERYDWTSSGGPGSEMTPGTTTTARVVVEARRPISFVFPMLKSATGID